MHTADAEELSSVSGMLCWRSESGQKGWNEGANGQLAADATSRAASAARIVAEPLPAPKESKAAPRDIESSRAEVEVLEVAAVPSAAEVMRPSC